MKAKIIFIFFLPLSLILILIQLSCKKTSQEPPTLTSINSNNLPLKETPLNLIKKNSNLINGKLDNSLATLSTYVCGSNISGSTAATGYYTYPSTVLDLTSTLQGSTVSITVSSFDVPNRFSIYDANNNYITSTNWMGYASYSGPWGYSINTPETTTLQFIKGSSNTYSIKVETSVQSVSDSWTASVACKYIPNVSNIQVTDVAVKNIMINAFSTLNVNFTTLGTDLGLGHALTANDLDFTQIYQSYDVNNPDTGKAITVKFKTNSNTNLNNYGFTLYTDGITYFKPMIIHSRTNQFLKYYDLNEYLLATINNYSLSTYTFSTVAGNFAPIIAPSARGCGQAVMNCMGDLYSNHGWLSVWAFVQTAFIPETAVAVAATCAVHNCR